MNDSLPCLDRCVLRCVQRLVHPAERADWLRNWQAELWWMRHGRQRSRIQAFCLSIDFFSGLALDAMWLRTESWRQIFAGTSTLCLAVLFGFCALSACMNLLLAGGWQAGHRHLGQEAVRCLVGSPLVLFVTSATLSSRHIEPKDTVRTSRWRRKIFFVAKTSLALSLTFLLSAGLCEPIHTSFHAAADLLQIFTFVVLSIFALRWSFHDQEARCKMCLRSLTTPERVGKPSHNLLEWTGTEQICRQGHGTLSVPEMETSWRQYSQWFAQDSAAFDRPAGA